MSHIKKYLLVHEASIKNLTVVEAFVALLDNVKIDLASLDKRSAYMTAMTNFTMLFLTRSKNDRNFTVIKMNDHSYAMAKE